MSKYNPISGTSASGSGPVNLLLGFAAAALAVLTVHQSIVYGLGLYKLSTSVPWSLKPFGPFNVPQLVNSMFWGGLWGALFAAVWPKLPGGAMWLRGLFFGLLIAVISNWMLVPFVKGTLFKMPNQVFFAGGVPERMAVTMLIQAGFGSALGLIYGLLRGRR
jgi:hypothetical protein